MNEFHLKPGMLLGVSTSAVQIDGGELNNSWNDWYAQNKIRDGSNPSVATDHWNHWREDIMLMHRLGIQTYRFSIEWARVEPEEGYFDEEAISHIKEELMFMIAMGIRPLVTLHYYSNPMWFERKKGWEDYENVRCFLIYVEKMVKAFGHLVSEYITINEPNIYAIKGYLHGSWPPGKRSFSTAMSVISNMASAHIKSYRLIHDVRRSFGFRDTKVSYAGNYRIYEPQNHLNPVQRIQAVEAEHIFQELVTEAMVTGEFRRPLKNNGRDRKGTYCDFYAINYDTRTAISRNPSNVKKQCYKNDLGWEIYPEGILQICSTLMKLRPMPIYITGNGTCDLADGFRSRFIYDHLKILCESKLPVKRYYYRCFNDGFEWLEGNYARSGIVHTDFDTMQRTVKRSGEFYSNIIQKGGVTSEMYDEYISGTNYHF